jgi:hypothetical protein
MVHALEEEAEEEAALLASEMDRVRHLAFVKRRIVDNTQRKVRADVMMMMMMLNDDVDDDDDDDDDNYAFVQVHNIHCTL